MKSLVILLLAAATCALLPLPSSAADEKKAPAATVTLTDTITGMSRLGDKKIEVRLSVPRGQSILTAPHVFVDENKVKINPLGRETVAFEGTLTTKDVVVGHTNSIPPHNITAKAFYLTADKATVVTDQNKASFPAAGQARVQGKGLTGKYEAGKGVETSYAVANGDQPILLLDKDGKPLGLKKLPATVRATGRLRVGDKGVLVLDAETVEEAPAEK